MRHLSFHEMELENFRSFRGAHSFRFADYEVGLHFLIGKNREEPRLGSNGSGKSTLWEALVWCIYARTSHNLRSPDVRSWGVKSPPRVKLRVRIDGKLRTIERIGRTNGLTIGGKAASQSAVERIIGMSFEVFVNAVLLGQGSPLFFDLTPQRKMALLVDVLDLQKWDRRAAIAASRVVMLNEKSARTKGELAGLIGERARLKVERTRVLAELKDWDKTRRLKARKKGEERELLAARVAELADKLVLEKVSEDMAAAELKLQEASNRRRLAELADARSNFAAAEARIEEQAARLETLQKRLARAGRAKHCPTCGQLIVKRKFDTSELRVEIDALTQQTDAGVPRKVIVALKNAELHHRKSMRAVDRMQQKWSELDHSVAMLQSGLELKQRELTAIDAELEVLADQSNPFRAMSQRLRGSIGELSVQIGELEDIEKRRDALIRRTRFWIKGFKEVRLEIIQTVLSQLELVTNTILEQLGLVGWQVRYSAEKELKSGGTRAELSIFIASPHNTKPVRWECWSGGEAQRLRIAGALALSEVLLSHAGVKPDIEVLDEPTSRLSVEGVKDMAEFLAQRAELRNIRVWYVDHQAVESEFFASVSTVVRDHNGSHLRQ